MKIRKKQQNNQRSHSKKQPSPASELFAIALESWRTGRFAPAESGLKRLLKQFPNHLDSHHLLAVILERKGDRVGAIQHLKTAITINPKASQCHDELANIYFSIGEFNNALTHFEITRSLGYNQSNTSTMIGRCLRELNDYQGALEALSEAISLDPNNQFSHLYLGTCYRETGQLNLAENAYEQAIRIDPEFALAYYLLATTGTAENPEILLRKMENLINGESQTVQGKIFLGFGLGKLYEDARNPQESFRYYHLANQLKRQLISPDLVSVKYYFDTLKQVFSDLAPGVICGPDTSGCTPILILGMPRSGSSLLEQIIAAHPDVHGAGELPLLEQSLNTASSDGLYLKFPDDFRSLTSQHGERIAQKYLLGLQKLRPGAEKFVIDKLPQNFYFIGAIRRLLPSAKIIHIIRNPVATCFSCYKNYFGPGMLEFTYDLGELGEYYLLYRSLMDFWHLEAEEDILEVHYENIIANQANETEKILNFCGLNWDDRCFEFHQSQKTVRTASFAQVRKPVYDSSLNSWNTLRSKLEPLISVLHKGGIDPELK